MVVRFNGGAQAGHTVVTPEGSRHVFSHFGSGTFLGIPTFLSSFFVCNPILFLRELELLENATILPTVYAHPNCLVTTFADMIINQWSEDALGVHRHGSCGVGVNETVTRSSITGLSITMSDLWNRTSLEDRLAENCRKYAKFRTGKAITKNVDSMIAEFISRCERFAQLVHPLGISQCEDPVFEGAQGLLLDQRNKQFFPHVTRSNTGSKNVKRLCHQAGITDIELYYVSRTYLTRHGAGPLPSQDPSMNFKDETNVEHPYQGTLRFAPLDSTTLIQRCTVDAEGLPFKLVLTHADQLIAPIHEADLYSYGPTRLDVGEDACKPLKTVPMIL